MFLLSLLSQFFKKIMKYLTFYLLQKQMYIKNNNNNNETRVNTENRRLLPISLQ